MTLKCSRGRSPAGSGGNVHKYFIFGVGGDRGVFFPVNGSNCKHHGKVADGKRGMNTLHCTRHASCCGGSNAKGVRCIPLFCSLFRHPKTVCRYQGHLDDANDSIGGSDTFSVGCFAVNFRKFRGNTSGGDSNDSDSTYFVQAIGC